MNKKNIFATVLTYAAPSSNYRGESEENRTILQRITRGGAEYAIISPESMRNALREQIAGYDLPTNRRRLHDVGQLAVEFREFPNADKFADDFFFGFMVADEKSVPKGQPAKRDSVLRMNVAVALSPYRFDATFHQSPLNAGDSPWKNSATSALLHKEVSYTAFQYPFALAMRDCESRPEWTKKLLVGIGELSNVAGGHARSYFEMAPKSIVARVTTSLAAGFDTYGFNEKGEFPELKRIHSNDLPGAEFLVGGELARGLPSEVKDRLSKEGVQFFDSPQKLLEALGRIALS